MFFAKRKAFTNLNDPELWCNKKNKSI